MEICNNIKIKICLNYYVKHFFCGELKELMDANYYNDIEHNKTVLMNISRDSFNSRFDAGTNKDEIIFEESLYNYIVNLSGYLIESFHGANFETDNHHSYYSIPDFYDDLKINNQYTLNDDYEIYGDIELELLKENLDFIQYIYDNINELKKINNTYDNTFEIVKDVMILFDNKIPRSCYLKIWRKYEHDSYNAVFTTDILEDADNYDEIFTKSESPYLKKYLKYKNK